MNASEAQLNIRVGRGTAVHVAYGNLPRCDTGTGARGGVTVKTVEPVTCKRCLRICPNANAPVDQPTPKPAPVAKYRLDYPAIEGRVVTEGHAKMCRQIGHAKHEVNGVETDFCPRCGDPTAPDKQSATTQREQVMDDDQKRALGYEREGSSGPWIKYEGAWNREDNTATVMRDVWAGVCGPDGTVPATNRADAERYFFDRGLIPAGEWTVGAVADFVSLTAFIKV